MQIGHPDYKLYILIMVLTNINVCMHTCFLQCSHVQQELLYLQKKKKFFACITTCTDVLKWKHIPVPVCLWCLWHKDIFGLYFCLFVFDCHHVCSCKEQEVCMYDLAIIHELWKMPIYQQHKREKKKKWRKASFILMLYLEFWSGNMRNHL